MPNAVIRLRGFTLIELLIVIAIISIVATLATLTISANQNKQLESLTKEICNFLSLAEEEAMLRPATLGVRFSPTGYQFYQFEETPKPAHWQALSETLLRFHAIAPNVQLTLKTGSPLIFSPSGDITAFKILIGKKGTKPHYEIIGEENGYLHYSVIHESA